MRRASSILARMAGRGWPVALGLLAAVLPARLADAAAFVEPAVPGMSEEAVVLGRDLDGDGDPDEVTINLEVIELQEEVYPGKFVTFWVFAPEAKGMVSPARMPSPTIRVEQGDHVKIVLRNTHYFPHTIHLHGTIHPNDMDGVPDVTQEAVRPGSRFVYAFIAKNPGTHLYHCHVQPDVHVMMGLVGMLIIEPNRANNVFTHLVPGAGLMPDLSKAAVEAGYDREYSLVYMDIDSHLNRIVEESDDPREIEKRMHRDYDSTKRRPDIFLLNGRSFPFTLRDTLIRVKEGERVLLRVANAGARTISLHIHGHHPTLLALDGDPVPEGMRYSRDVFTLTAAQRIDLLLRTAPDDRYASGPGVWILHDHTEQAVTNEGISPGGDLSAIAYDGFVRPDGLPRVAGSLDRFFDPAYYRGERPVFDPSIFHVTRAGYGPRRGAESARARPVERAAADAAAPAARGEPGGHSHHGAAAPPGALPERARLIEEHRPVARSCKTPRGFRRVTLKGGVEFAAAGEVFGFAPKTVHVGRCEEVEVVFENTDSVRHALMIPGLNPMFMLEFQGPGTRSARFVTPDEDITLPFHCHVPTHEEMGMAGLLVVGTGGEPETGPPAATGRLVTGVGKVVLADPGQGQIVVDHEEIPGFMAAMVMGYPVKPPRLLQGLKPGERIRFAIDPGEKAIVDIEPLTVTGVGTVVLADTRKGQIVVDHEEIPGFMAAMVMGYPVKPARLLQGLKRGERIRFTIDTEQEAIVAITPAAN